MSNYCTPLLLTPKRMRTSIIGSLAFVGFVQGHIAAWNKGMYCFKGTSGSDDPNTNEAVNPLYMLTKSDWWFHHVNDCDKFPPDSGNFLTIPSGGSFTVELATNRAFTTFSNNGAQAGLYPDGSAHPGLGSTGDCITDPNIHTKNQGMASGTAFAISYQSDLSKVTPENLVVFSVLRNTVWQRKATYEAPLLPACPAGGCICAWGWIPNGCGTPNMYMEGFRCKVTGASGSVSLAAAKPAKWCEGNPKACVTGAKQMLFWNQADGNNIEVSGYDQAGDPKSPAYNSKCGFSNGAQHDIFTGGLRRDSVGHNVNEL